MPKNEIKREIIIEHTTKYQKPYNKTPKAKHKQPLNKIKIWETNTRKRSHHAFLPFSRFCRKTRQNIEAALEATTVSEQIAEKLAKTQRSNS